MPVQRKRFRIEQVGYDAMAMPETIDASPMPYHNEIMSELRAIRAQMAAPHGEATNPADVPKAEKLQATIDAYRAQIEQCEKLKVELDLIHEAINRTKREIAVLHGKSFHGDEMTKVTEEATQQILEAAEAIDEAASALSKSQSADQQARLSAEIGERVVTIFEACNFQDLTGQRIQKVMATMKFIEHHINVMMEIWGGVDAIKAHAPPIVDERVGDARLLNGPKSAGEEGHASQNDIDAMFG
jgi:chemotaxis protein CheZ